MLLWGTWQPLGPPLKVKLLVGYISQVKSHQNSKELHPRKLTWNLKRMVSKRNLLFQGSIFRFHVRFRGSKGIRRSPKMFQGERERRATDIDHSIILHLRFRPRCGCKKFPTSSQPKWWCRMAMNPIVQSVKNHQKKKTKTHPSKYTYHNP